jgi:FKBP-type peptidyl-prolyl cis-trans isomerase FklB
MNKKLLYFIAALSTGLFFSCVSDEETSEANFEEDLKKIENFVQSTELPVVREQKVGDTGIVLLFTEENPEGETAVEGDSLWVNYTGYFLDGSVFDTSIEQTARDNNMFNASREYEPYPIKLAYTQVITGWHYALAQMKEGEKATALIPSSYAYGPYGQGTIGPNTVLAFDLELVEVKKP